MLLHTQVTSVCHLDQKIHFDEKKVSNFHSLTKFLKGYFKAHFERMILKPFWGLKTFFQRILKNFLLVVWRIRDYFSFGIGVGGQDSILNFSIWRPESENHSKSQSVLILIKAISFSWNWILWPHITIRNCCQIFHTTNRKFFKIHFLLEKSRDFKHTESP